MIFSIYLLGIQELKLQKYYFNFLKYFEYSKGVLKSDILGLHFYIFLVRVMNILYLIFRYIIYLLIINRTNLNLFSVHPSGS